MIWIEPAPWQVMLNASRHLFSSGDTVTMTATELSGQDVALTNGRLKLFVYDVTKPSNVVVCSDVCPALRRASGRK